MKTTIILTMGLLSFLSSCFTGKHMQVENVKDVQVKKSIYDFSIKSLDGSKDINLSDYKGKKILFVNVASKCGYTGQYEGLQKLSEDSKDKAVIIGFPCNQFGGQEPGGKEEIATFCQKNYGVTFPITEKIEVKGDNIHPIYAWLTQKSLNGALDSEVKWNFNKFLVNENGVLTNYYGSGDKPADIKL